ncbi:uncharacterized protein LY89DRAFT_728832 [Mollisia scopiformis]|uniref:Uncharacterized protein n=1 Tax=Mollisia scopiformis TaxID=149040 RepID=A0A194XR96_MOLSC|nr:uncharacterized protein LY89DRAFT_728832 [Mollisia scopiformis]KUJ22713.1 hypothetical protein LY89DRAFT_728832 [Mollisia scopiformis]
MFCSSLRKRPAWASLPATLLSLRDPTWKETTLEAQDLQIPVPRQHQRGQVDLFNIILLSASDMQASADAIARVEQLYHKTGGRNIGVIFLLQEKPPQGNTTANFMELQMALQNLEIPIVPLATISNLQTTLSAFQRQLFLSRSSAASASPPNPAMSLLPYCSTGHIPEHARHVLSDLCHSIPDLAQAAMTRDGQMGLRQWFSDSMPQVAEELIAFWEQEFVVD